MTTTATDKPKPNLMQRLVALRLALGEGRVAKGGTAPAVMGGFKFIEWDETAPKLGSLFAEHGIVPWPSMESYDVGLAGTTSSGKPVYRATVWLSFEFINADDPQDRLSLRWVGVGDDTSDKGAQKAATSAAKSILLKAFLLGGATDGDASDTKIDRASSRTGAAGSSTSTARADSPVAPPSLAAGEREFRQGDVCPFCKEMRYRTRTGLDPKFYPAKGGPRKGGLECNGITDDNQWCHHEPPIPESEIQSADALPDFDYENVQGDYATEGAS